MSEPTEYDKDEIIRKQDATIAALTRTLREASEGHKRLREENERLKKTTEILAPSTTSLLKRAEDAEERLATAEARERELREKVDGWIAECYQTSVSMPMYLRARLSELKQLLGGEK